MPANRRHRLTRSLHVRMLYLILAAIDLALIDERGRKVDLFGRTAACFICRGETSPGRRNVELLHPGGGRRVVFRPGDEDRTKNGAGGSED